MPRLFWKLFLALWLSIMAFSAVMAWVNASLVAHQPADERARSLARTAEQVERRLVGALERDDRAKAANIIERLPRHVRSHVYVTARDQRELLGRERGLSHLERRRAPARKTHVESKAGTLYTVIVFEPMPPGALLEPGLRGVLHRLLIAALVSAILSGLLARYLARPLEQLGRAGRQLGSGDLSARVGAPLDSRADEFGQLARNLDDMAARLQELQEANHRLLRDVSHELRSPLARMRVALELARNRQGADVGRELDRIELESERLETLIGEVLGLLRDSSEPTPIRPERFDLAEMLGDLGEVVNYEAPEGSPGVQLQLTPPLPVTADRELLWRAVENLLRNALRHTDPARGVELTARARKKGGVEICVTDHGPGLPAAQLTRVFEPFYRVQEARDRDSGGHGLGLAIAAAAVRRHHGSITAANRPEGGLAFCIELPEGTQSGAVSAEGDHLVQ